MSERQKIRAGDRVGVVVQKRAGRDIRWSFGVVVEADPDSRMIHVRIDGSDEWDAPLKFVKWAVHLEDEAKLMMVMERLSGQ
jgi:hypothetical protein